MRINPFRLVFDTVAGQVIFLMVLSILTMHGILTLHVYWSHFEGRMPSAPGETTGQAAGFVKMFANAPVDIRETVIEVINKSDSRADARVAELPANAEMVGPNHLTADIGSVARVYAVDRNPPSPIPEVWGNLFFEIADGTVLHLYMPKWDDPPIGPASLTLIFLGVATTLLVGWTAMVITGPLRRFATAVENFRDMRDDTIIPEDGPREIRAAISSFNRMRMRIGKLMAERTAMLAAVSHDLRTPITRMRLRAEFIEDAAIRTPILADLDHMSALTQAALTHLSGSESREPYESADLPSLLQTIADQFSDTGHDVSYSGPQRLSAQVRLRDIQRAVSNLVDNATRFGTHVVISLEAVSPKALEIVVTDDGPGIPETERNRLQEPFVRGDAARTPGQKAGFGLGLTIARDIAEAHGGGLHLADATPHGLRATLAISTK